MSVDPADFVNIYVFTPGRILFAVADVKRRAQQRDIQPVIAACNKSLDAAQLCLDTENAWNRTKNAPGSRGDGEAKAIDPLLDRAVSGTQDSVMTITRSLSPDHQLVISGKEFLRKAFPAGAIAITNLAYEDELAAVKNLLGRLADSNDLKPYVAKLNLQPYIAEMSSLADVFETALRSSAPAEVSFGEVKASRANAQNWLLALVLKVGGLFPEPTPQDAEARAFLLEPIMDQNTRIAAIHRRRQPVPDVDPNTGDEQPETPAQPPVVPPAGPTV